MEPYPELNGGQNIRRARGPVQSTRYIYHRGESKIRIEINHFFRTNYSLACWDLNPGSPWSEYKKQMTYMFYYASFGHSLKKSNLILKVGLFFKINKFLFNFLRLDSNIE